MPQSDGPASPQPAPQLVLEIDPAWEVHPAQVKAWLDAKDDLLLLDVRQLKEWQADHIDAAQLIPLDRLPAEAATLDTYRDRRVVVHCHLGRRSLRAAAFLRARGFTNVHSMAGGMEAWTLLLAGRLK